MMTIPFLVAKEKEEIIIGCLTVRLLLVSVVFANVSLVISEQFRGWPYTDETPQPFL